MLRVCKVQVHTIYAQHTHTKLLHVSEAERSVRVANCISHFSSELCAVLVHVYMQHMRINYVLKIAVEELRTTPAYPSSALRAVMCTTCADAGA